MAGVQITVHHRIGFDFGPVSKFVPPTMQVQENADPGGGQPSEPNALMFVDPVDGEAHVFVLNEETRKLLVQRLTGGIVLPGLGEVET